MPAVKDKLSINHSLLVDLYELTMAQSYFYYRRHAKATFDLFVRKMPPNRSFLLFCGLEDALTYLKNLKFKKEDLLYLRKIGFDKPFLDYLKTFKFSGDVWSMPEGTVFFPQEPVVRVTGSLIEAQIVESFLLNCVNLSTMIATKAARISLAARGKGVYDFSLRRTHGVDAAIKAARSAYVAGFLGTSNVEAARRFNIKAVGTMAHSFVMSFSSEKESFRAFFNSFPQKSILLVDTYNVKEGMINAISVANELKSKGYFLKGVRIDSGDIAVLSRLARRMLDKAGLCNVKIFASGDLDEYKIHDLVLRGAPVDDFGVGTKMGTSFDAPCLDVIYKICEIADREGDFIPTMKLSKGKITLPGRKQVYRRFDSKGVMKEDIIGMEEEGLGMPLLTKVFSCGRIIGRKEGLFLIRRRAEKNLASLGVAFKGLYGKDKYKVSISPRLGRLLKDLTLRLKNSR